MRFPESVKALAIQQPLLIHIQALSKSRRNSQSGLNVSSLESAVAATMVLQDRATRTARLAWLHVANHEDPFDHLLGVIMEQLWGTGMQRLVASTGLSPYLGSGVLLDHFHREPPLHTPYNPPYYPDLLHSAMQLTSRNRLYELRAASCLPEARQIIRGGPARLSILSPRQLGGGLLDLFQVACVDQPFPIPTYADVQCLLQQLVPWPVYGWIARIDRQPVGFVLIVADGASVLRRTKGGRNPLWRLWIHWRKKTNFATGRLLFAGVLPAWQRKGIGTQLLAQTLITAQKLGWKSMTAGPLAPNSPGALFLTRYGAQPRQTIGLFEMEL